MEKLKCTASVMLVGWVLLAATFCTVGQKTLAGSRNVDRSPTAEILISADSQIGIRTWSQDLSFGLSKMPLLERQMALVSNQPPALTAWKLP